MMKLLQEEQLKQRARKLGIECNGLEIPHERSGEHAKVYEYELQRKIMEVERHFREHRLWIMALVSAIASMVSAFTALIALLWRL